MFYLLDDAFRVGEYIQSGNYKGTVKSFSFRSVRLRHQRGALYTVPFALLGAVQNQSRDWTIDKLMVGITYDSDIDKARKLIKQIGLELAEDPEFKPLIIEPLKMQGVDALGDFAVQLRMKMMTLPGENFPIRRQALAMIKKAFDANGIKFAFPTVQIAGDGEPGHRRCRSTRPRTDQARRRGVIFAEGEPRRGTLTPCLLGIARRLAGMLRWGQRCRLRVAVHCYGRKDAAGDDRDNRDHRESPAVLGTSSRSSCSLLFISTSLSK